MKYKDKLSGKELTFTPESDQVMVRTRISPDVDALTAVAHVAVSKLPDEENIELIVWHTTAGGNICTLPIKERM